jgi:hypothetical protein
MSDENTLLFQTFYHLIAIPRTKHNLDIHQLTPEIVINTYQALYTDLVAPLRAKNKSTKVMSFVTFDRLFDVRTGLALKTGKQLESVICEAVHTSQEFHAMTVNNQVTCVIAKEALEVFDVDYFDISEGPVLNEVEQNTHVLMLPIIFVTSDPEITVEKLFAGLKAGNKMTQFIDGINSSPVIGAIARRATAGSQCYNEFVLRHAVGSEGKRMSSLVFTDVTSKKHGK